MEPTEVGTIPDAMALCLSIMLVDLRNNQLSGAIPSFMSTMWQSEVGIVLGQNPSGPLSRDLRHYISEELKEAVAVSEEKSSSVPAGAANFPAAVSLPESAQTLAGIAFRAAGKSENHFPAASKFAGKPFQQVIDLLMGLFRRAVFHHGGGALKQPIKRLQCSYF